MQEAPVPSEVPQLLLFNENPVGKASDKFEAVALPLLDNVTVAEPCGDPT